MASTADKLRLLSTPLELQQVAREASALTIESKHFKVITVSRTTIPTRPAKKSQHQMTALISHENQVVISRLNIAAVRSQLHSGNSNISACYKIDGGELAAEISDIICAEFASEGMPTTSSSCAETRICRKEQRLCRRLAQAKSKYKDVLSSRKLQQQQRQQQQRQQQRSKQV